MKALSLTFLACLALGLLVEASDAVPVWRQLVTAAGLWYLVSAALSKAGHSPEQIRLQVAETATTLYRHDPQITAAGKALHLAAQSVRSWIAGNAQSLKTALAPAPKDPAPAKGEPEPPEGSLAVPPSANSGRPASESPEDRSGSSEIEDAPRPGARFNLGAAPGGTLSHASGDPTVASIHLEGGGPEGGPGPGRPGTGTAEG